MLISKAYAQEATADITADVTTMTDTPSMGNAFAWNMGVIALLVFMFYFLLIRPQQKRFQAHKEQMDGLKKGDRITTAGGLIGTIDSIVNKEEVIVDLGNNIKVTALRYTLSEIVDKTKTAAK